MHTIQEYNSFEEKLIKNGYRKVNGHLDRENFYFYKSFGKSEYEEGRSNYQIIVKVYDFSEFLTHSALFKERPISYEYITMVSRNVNERIDLHMPEEDIDTVEHKAELFFEWASNNYNVEKNEY